MITNVFLFFFVLYLLYALWENVVRRAEDGQRLSPISTSLQVPLFVLGTVLAVRAGVVSRELVFLPAIGLGVVLGHLVFVASLVGTRVPLRDAWEHFRHVGPVAAYLRDDPMTLFRIFGVSMSEEIIYRAAAQPALGAATGSTVAGIVLAAVAFCLVHAHFFRNPWEQSVEFTAFALVLGGLYFWTGNLMLVALVHAVRNWEIAYIEFALDRQAAAGAAVSPTLDCTNEMGTGTT